MSTAVITTLLVIAAVLGIKGCIKRLYSGCCKASGEKMPKRLRVKDKDLSHYPYEKVLKVDGMSCGICSVRVENTLNALEGTYARVDLDRGQADVYMKEDTGDKALRDAVREAGYTVYRINRIK